MSPNLFSYLRFLVYFLRIKLLNLTSSFPPLPGGKLDEQTWLERQAAIALGEVPLEQVTPAQARTNFNGLFPLLKKIGGIYEEVDTIRNLTIPGPAGSIPARLYLPGKNTDMPLFVLLHGGGWVIGNLDSHDNMARFLCKRVPCVVLSVDYRLAPENPFPAAVDDSFAAVQWAVEHAVEINANPQRVLVGGDSAGGNLSAVIAQLARQKGTPHLAGQVLFYPATNAATLDTPSYQAFGDKPFGLPKRDIEWYLRMYIPNPKDRLNPLVSPLLATDLQGLPSALVVTAEFDVLRDEGEEYARKMEAAGVKVKLLRANGMVHGFLSIAGLIRRATQYFDQVVGEIRRMVS